MNGWTDRRTDEQIDGRTEERLVLAAVAPSEHKIAANSGTFLKTRPADKVFPRESEASVMSFNEG